MSRWNGGECKKKETCHKSNFQLIYVSKWSTDNCKMFLSLASILALVSLPTPSASQGDNTALPLTLPARVISNNQQAVCPPDEVWETERNETAKGHSKLDTHHHYTNPLSCCYNPLASCSSLQTSSFSGYYWVQSHNSTAVQVYCDMDRMCQHWRVDLCSQSKYEWPIPAVSRWMEPANTQLRTKEAVWKGQ